MDCPVVILCGGRGMRLNEHTLSIPKPMIEIGGMPILWHIMKTYSASGFRKFILCLGYKGDKIRDYLIDLPRRSLDCTLHLSGAEARVEYHQGGLDDWEITFVDTGADTETGGRIKKIEKYINAETFFVSYGDGVSDISIKALLQTHKERGFHATMTCTQPITTFGTVDVHPSGRVGAFKEKPRLGGTRINGGFFCFNREVFRYIGDGETLEQEPMQRLIAERQLGAYVHDGFWACMDTFKDYQQLNDMWNTGKPPWRVW